MKINYE